MKYKKPECEILKLEMLDVLCNSLTDKGAGEIEDANGTVTAPGGEEGWP